MSLTASWVRLHGWALAGLPAILLCLPAPGQSLAAPPLRISAELTWEDVYTNDPLRVRVRLNSPQARQSAALRTRQLELGQPASDPIPPPAVASNWWETVQLSLYRITNGPARELVLAPEQWVLYLRPLLAEPSFLEAPLVTRSREWLLPSAIAGLSAGPYVLAVAWNGSGMTDTNLLPSDGVLQAQELDFAASAPTNNFQLATHLGRLAFQEYMLGNPAQARAYGRESLDLDPQSPDRERVETYFVVAHSALRLQDYLGSADTFQRMLRALPSSVPDEAIALARERLNLLAPRLQAPPGAETNRAFRVQVLGLPGQHYVTFVSTNLSSWLPLATNTASGNWFEVFDVNTASWNHRFYRAVWVP